MPSLRYNLVGPIWAKDLGRTLLREATQDTLKYGRGLVRSLTPVRSGAMKQGWQTDKNSIYNQVPYSGWVDQGTKRMKGRLITKRSAPQIAAYYAQSLSKQVKRVS